MWWQPNNPLIDRGEGDRQAERQAFWAWLAQRSSEAADRYQVARRAAALAVAEAKNPGVRGVLDRPWRKILANNLTTDEWKAGFSQSCVQQGSKTAYQD